MRTEFIIMAAVVSLSVEAARAEGYEAVEVTNGGSIVGEVRYLGSAPERVKLIVDRDKEVCAKEAKLDRSVLVGYNGGLENAVVYLFRVEKGKRWVPGQYVLDQKECLFEPHVLLVPVGSDLAIANNDGILHMIRSYSAKNPPFNIGQPKFNLEFSKRLKSAEIITMKCDIHTWMKAHIIVHDHPYYTVTGSDGAFELSEILPGQYYLEVWHEALGKKRQSVTVEPGSKVRATFAFEPEP